jgi:hypothetical protein
MELNAFAALYEVGFHAHAKLPEMVLGQKIYAQMIFTQYPKPIY